MKKNEVVNTSRSNSVCFLMKELNVYIFSTKYLVLYSSTFSFTVKSIANCNNANQLILIDVIVTLMVVEASMFWIQNNSKY